MNGGPQSIPLSEAMRQHRQRPTVEGSREAWLAHSGPVHAPSLARRTIPDREWAVAGLVPHKTVTLFSADGEMGKSTMAQQLACATVLGRQWLGRDVRPGKAVIVSCEDDLDEVHRRLAAIARAEDFDLADLEGLEIFDRVGCDSAVMVRSDRFGEWDESPWWINFSNWCRDFGPGLIVLDSLYDFFSGDQLSQAAARLFMGKLRELANDANTAILILWHPSKSGMESGDGTSGVVAFRNAARSMLFVERADKEDRNGPRIIKQRKNNYGPTAEPFAVQWENGRFVLTDEAPEPQAARRPTVTGAAKIALDMLRKAIEEGGEPLPTSNHTPTDKKGVSADLWRRYAYSGAIAETDSPEARKKAFKRAADRLQSGGFIGTWEGWVWLV